MTPARTTTTTTKNQVEQGDKAGNSIVGGEFKAFHESATTGPQRQRQRQKHHQSRLDESPSTTNADFVANKNRIHSPEISNHHKSVAVVNETNVIENIPPPPHTKTQLFQLVDDFFFKISDTDAMTVGGINHSVASHYGWGKVDIPRRSIIKDRLTLLVMGKVKPGSRKVGKRKQTNETETEKVDDENDDDKLRE